MRTSCCSSVSLKWIIRQSLRPGFWCILECNFLIILGFLTNILFVKSSQHLIDHYLISNKFYDPEQVSQLSFRGDATNDH